MQRPRTGQSQRARPRHPAGDALLQAIGAAIQGAARADDGVFRYGGDEFALILQGVDAATAASIGDRVRRAVARLTAKELSPVTITVGVGSWPADADDKNALIGAADTALYFGKQSGEDRVVLAADVPRDMRDLRGTLDQLARAALQRADEPRAVEHLMEHAAQLGGESDEYTLRDALLSMARTLDARDAGSRRHADRVGQLAAATTRVLGCSEEEVRDVELAARLHGLELEATAELHGVPSLARVDEIMRASRHASLGSRSMPVAAQVVAAANAYDVMTSGMGGTVLTPQAAIAEIRSQKRRFRKDVLDALATAVQPKRAAPPARREGDPDDEVAGAA